MRFDTDTPAEQTGFLLTVLTAAVWFCVCGIDPFLNPEAHLQRQSSDRGSLPTARRPRQQQNSALQIITDRFKYTSASFP